VQFEDTELTPEGPRIVRVAKSGEKTLAQRVRDDYGGRRKFSPLRKNIGLAFLSRAHASAEEIKNGSNLFVPMPAWEEQVTAYMESHFSFVCLDFDDRDERARAEKWLIGLLSAWLIAPPSEAWLGRHGPRVVARSGLGNVRHVLRPGSGMDRASLLRLRYLEGAVAALHPLRQADHT